MPLANAVKPCGLQHPAPILDITQISDVADAPSLNFIKLRVVE
jgi:hypothetical protein